MKKLRYYLVVAKHGHVGSHKFFRKTIPIGYARSKEHARNIAKNKEGVKKNADLDLSYIIESVTEVSKEMFLEYYSQWKSDPYYSCTSIQEVKQVVDPSEIKTIPPRKKRKRKLGPLGKRKKKARIAKSDEWLQKKEDKELGIKIKS